VGIAGSLRPVIVHTGWITGRSISLLNRRPSTRSRERTSQRWYSNAQCGAGHRLSAAW
jgi:hypothetical protein